MLGWIITFLVIALIAGALGLVALQARQPVLYRFFSTYFL